MANVLISLIGNDVIEQARRQALPFHEGSRQDLDEQDRQEQEIEDAIRSDAALETTERTALIKARKGQGLFRDRVRAIEPRCRVTGVANPAHLIASHIKPWRRGTNCERLDGNNGLMLAPHIDHLFDDGFISFADNGLLLISPVADLNALRQMGVPVDYAFNAGRFTAEQLVYLECHRDEVFKRALRHP